MHAVDLAAHVLRALVERNDLDPALVDDVIMGCLDQVGEQGINIGRIAPLAAGLPDSVPGTTVDRQCGSSQQSAHFAAQGVMAGAYDIVIAAGVESMTRVPFWSNLPDKTRGLRTAVPRPVRAWAPTTSSTRASRVRSSPTSGRSVARSSTPCPSSPTCGRPARPSEGRFAREIIPMRVVTEDGEEMMATDEGIRATSTMEGLAKLRTVFREDGKLTAGNSSQITDGAAALLIMSERKAEELGLTPLARFHTFAVAGIDPIEMLSRSRSRRPARRSRAAASASTTSTCTRSTRRSHRCRWPGRREIGADMAQVNVNGGAIALGHPVGASGARLMATLVYELQRTEGRYGLQTMCEGGGMANATILERIA